MAIHAKKSGMLIAVNIISDEADRWLIKAIDEKTAKFVSKDGKQGMVFDGYLAIAEAEAWIREQRKPKVAVMTNAQICTLRRLSSGTEYRIRGDGRYAFERRGLNIMMPNDVNAPSIPPLIRKGMVEIDPRYTKPNATSYYPVRLTVLGATTVKAAVIDE
ncbi:MAG: hypothetical protein [Bacteriophage sp.]|nr:MAG: hypothetical protein [Bacteriophage sp.]